MWLTVFKMTCYTTYNLIGFARNLNLLNGNTSPNNFYQLLTRRFYWHYRLMVCSSAALLFSFCTWLLGFDIVWQLVSVIIGFLLGFLWPIRHSKRKSLSWLDKHIGLSYRTLLELKTNQSEDFGLTEALKKRASYLIKRTNLPQMLPLWLLPLSIALILILLPSINLPTSSRTVPSLLEDFYVPPKQVRQETYNEKIQEKQDLQGNAQEGLNSKENLPIENQTRNSSRRNTSNSNIDPNTNDEFDPTLVDNKILEKLLENATESEESFANPFRPIEHLPPQDFEEAETESNSSENSDSTNVEPPTSPAEEVQSEPEDRQITSNENVESPDSPTEEVQSGPEDIPSNENPEVSESEEGEQASDGSESESEQIADTDTTNDQSKSEQIGNTTNNEQNEQRNQAVDNNSEESPEIQGEAGTEGTQPDSDLAGQEQSQEDDQITSISNEDESAGMGNTVSTVNTKSLGPSSGEITRLEGELLDGPSNLAGEVNLPGLAESNFPQADPTNSFRYSNEETTTEGRIPLEYQEILRNYFR